MACGMAHGQGGTGTTGDEAKPLTTEGTGRTPEPRGTRSPLERVARPPVAERASSGLSLIVPVEALRRGTVYHVLGQGRQAQVRVTGLAGDAAEVPAKNASAVNKTEPAAGTDGTAADGAGVVIDDVVGYLTTRIPMEAQGGAERAGPMLDSGQFVIPLRAVGVGRSPLPAWRERFAAGEMVYTLKSVREVRWERPDQGGERAATCTLVGVLAVADTTVAMNIRGVRVSWFAEESGAEERGARVWLRGRLELRPTELGICTAEERVAAGWAETISCGFELRTATVPPEAQPGREPRRVTGTDSGPASESPATGPDVPPQSVAEPTAAR